MNEGTRLYYQEYRDERNDSVNFLNNSLGKRVNNGLPDQQRVQREGTSTIILGLTPQHILYIHIFAHGSSRFNRIFGPCVRILPAFDLQKDRSKWLSFSFLFHVYGDEGIEARLF